MTCRSSGRWREQASVRMRRRWEVTKHERLGVATHTGVRRGERGEGRSCVTPPSIVITFASTPFVLQSPLAFIELWIPVKVVIEALEGLKRRETLDLELGTSAFLEYMAMHLYISLSLSTPYTPDRCRVAKLLCTIKSTNSKETAAHRIVYMMLQAPYFHEYVPSLVQQT